MPEKVKLPPLLCMTVNKTDPSTSEYRFSFTPKVKLVQPSIKLASSFMYRRPPDYVRGQPRESFQPGFVPAARYSGLGDYVFLHSNAFYSSTRGRRTYFTIMPDWVSEQTVRKNNPFSWWLLSELVLLLMPVCLCEYWKRLKVSLACDY